MISATLGSFPEPFQQGMAQRADILGDTGVAAPECWEGYLGTREVHGVLWWTLSRKAIQGRVPDAMPFNSCAIRAEVRKFIADHDEIEDEVRVFMDEHGAEVLHFETGEANYRQSDSGEIDRVEHFGFRDGISQPWIDFELPSDHDLASPASGGGTPRPDGTWAPLAPGEFVLGYPDEDGLVQPWPCNTQLRNDGTYMVFRKLEQDVVGFRNFLRGTDRNRRGAERLAADMVGRWPDGTPLVQSPNGPSGDVPRDPDRSINNFRYDRDDPHGLRCPISAHIRRVNPRDTGDRDEVRRHRILRRGMSYGGALLPEGSTGDGNKRGMLFIALNARIDQQFELLQAHWVNRGELAGQVGAGRDPIVGPHQGIVTDAFVCPSQPAPVTNLARFVTLRGGDYFFIPGLDALRGLAHAERFQPDPDAPLPKDAIGTLETPDPIASILTGKASLNAYQDVLKVLKDDATYGIDSYAYRIAQITGGGQMLIGLPSESAEYKTRRKILDTALAELSGDASPFPKLAAEFARVTRASMAALLKRVRHRGRLDIVSDVGRVVPIVLAERILGIPGPSWVSPTGIAAKFGRADITNIPRSWVAALPEVPDNLKPLISMQTWTRLAFIQVFVNVINAAEIADVAACSTAEMLRHIDQLIERARKLGANGETLLGCLVKLGRQPEQFELSRQAYDAHMRFILAELLVGGVELVNKALAKVVDCALDRPDILAKFRDAAMRNDDKAIDALVREALRFAPVSPILFRLTKKNVEFGDRMIQANTPTCLLIQAAMQDPGVFDDPRTFKCTRHVKDYLHFGDGGDAPPAPHACIGKAFAVAELREMVKALARLDQVRRAAGPMGKLQEDNRLPSSLVIRFDPIYDTARPGTSAPSREAGEEQGPGVKNPSEAREAQ